MAMQIQPSIESVRVTGTQWGKVRGAGVATNICRGSLDSSLRDDARDAAVNCDNAHGLVAPNRAPPVGGAT